MSCHCGAGESFETCCQPFHDGSKNPPTAEALMRARYCAFVVGNVDYVINTHDPKKRSDVSRKSIEEWSSESDWHGLEVISTVYGQAEDFKGNVTFVAHFTHEGERREHRESAQFRRVGPNWYFVDSKIRYGDPAVRSEDKVGRNDPCPCDSGKKYKKCCGAA